MSDFKGFRFGNIHIKDLHLTVVSSGDRFNKSLLPEPTDYSVDVPGGNGKYYFGQTHNSRTISVKTAFDNLDEYTIRKIRQIFATDKLKDLVFDEEPYKVYRAKLSRAPVFNYVCFLNKETNQRVYKGECDFDFVMYHPYAFCFNKYIVRAADYYKCTPPESIIKPSEDTYAINNPVPPLNKTIKEHYNTINNMGTPWKGGYPTIEQVQNGELFFKTPNGTKTIIDVRNYWDNIPRWQTAAKLLTTPTLDYDQELIYMPQYNKAQYYNMDIGPSKKNFAIGNRILVYNPGDIPIDFKLYLSNLINTFRGNTNYTFRISRYNVQRLTIDQAVDWIGLRTFRLEDEEQYKYGTHYFKISNYLSEQLQSLTDDVELVTKLHLKNLDESKQQEILGQLKQQNFKMDINGDPEIQKYLINLIKDNHEDSTIYTDLGYSAPRHCYIAEPVPQEKLGYFIRLFYKQSNLLMSGNTHFLNHLQGEQYAERYEELRDQCITDDERNELYWKTLKEAILDRYKDYNDTIEDVNKKIFKNDSEYEEFVYDFLNNPQEYIRQTNDLNYGEFNFNITHLPQYCTFDYLDINNNNFDKILNIDCGCDKNMQSQINDSVSLILDSESRMLYNERELKWEEDNIVNPLNQHNFYKVNKEKISFTDNIEKGHWFQLPPGWSLIDVSPIVDEDVWGGKRWLDARPFFWGSTNENNRTNYNEVYKKTIKDFIENQYPNRNSTKLKLIDNQLVEEKQTDTDDLSELEELIKFRLWDGDFEQPDFPQSYSEEKLDQTELTKLIYYSFKKYRVEKYEIQFLKLLDRYFSFLGVDINEWWWNSNNYMWINYPPLYWGFVDLLNKAKIEYIPQYY